MSYRSVGELDLIVGNPASAEAELCIVGLYDGARLSGGSEDLDRAADGLLKRALETGDFKGEKNETLLLYPTTGPARRILLVGLGPRTDLSEERIRQGAAVAARRCRDLGVSLAVGTLFGQDSDVTAEAAAQAFVEGVLLGTYQYIEYRTAELDSKKTLGRLEILVPNRRVRTAAQRGFLRGVGTARGVNLARTLAAHPGNHATPSFLVSEAKRIAKEKKLRCTIIDRQRMEKLGMGALLGVAKGSVEPPYFILLEYDCGRKRAPTIAVVGKGLTFDAGGISLKPAQKMEEMKFDMCGGAAVLGILSSVRDANVKVNVIGAVPASENLPSGSAYKPGDILRSHSGKTIEVQNCDAEGRLILADALSYVVKKYKPAAVIDMATLTGAVVIALGHYGAGLLSNNDRLASRIEEASGRTGERLWRLPLWSEINDHLKSDVADIKNIGDAGAGAGTIVGGAFLSHFIDGTPWAHIDIAGTAWWEKDRPYLPKGPSGYGVRLILDLLRSW